MNSNRHLMIWSDLQGSSNRKESNLVTLRPMLDLLWGRFMGMFSHKPQFADSKHCRYETVCPRLVNVDYLKLEVSSISSHCKSKLRVLAVVLESPSNDFVKLNYAIYIILKYISKKTLI